MYVANIIIEIGKQEQHDGSLKGMILKSYKSLIASLWEIQIESLLNNGPRGTGFTWTFSRGHS